MMPEMNITGCFDVEDEQLAYMTEGFDPDGEFAYDAFNGFVIDGASFNSIEYSPLPIK